MTTQCSFSSSITDSLVPCLHDPIFRNLDRRGIQDYIGEKIIPELRIMRLSIEFSLIALNSAHYGTCIAFLFSKLKKDIYLCTKGSGSSTATVIDVTFQLL